MGLARERTLAVVPVPASTTLGTVLHSFSLFVGPWALLAVVLVAPKLQPSGRVGKILQGEGKALPGTWLTWA